MRAPKRRRLRLRVVAAPSGVDLDVIAAAAHYIGSPEHKDGPSFAGEPRPRADASICSPELLKKQLELTRWLRNGIRLGHVSEHFDGDFPRYVWHREGDTVFEARVVNSGLGQYKGYPLNLDQWPIGLP